MNKTEEARNGFRFTGSKLD